jgi:hypothetical protein
MKKVVFFVMIFVIVAATGLVASAQDGGGACHGTYYVTVNIDGSDTPNYALWTFNQDGTFQGTDSAEIELYFSHQQGAWQHTRARAAKATWLDFSTLPDDPGVTRVDVELEFGDGCQTIDGDFDGAVYDDPGQDPLDPNTPISFTFSGSFTGQRVNP